MLCALRTRLAVFRLFKLFRLFRLFEHLEHIARIKAEGSTIGIACVCLVKVLEALLATVGLSKPAMPSAVNRRICQQKSRMFAIGKDTLDVANHQIPLRVAMSKVLERHRNISLQLILLIRVFRENVCIVACIFGEPLAF